MTLLARFRRKLLAKPHPRFADTKGEYRALWDSIEVRPHWAQAIEQRARKIIGNRDRYEELEARTGVPWWFLGAIHGRESGQSFLTHLHNGDSLKGRTRNAPRGRPRTGRPPFKWEDSAVDAIVQKGWHKINDWPIERVLFECERYNGWGYRMWRSHLSPYLWSGCQHYSGRGKYTSDGKYSSSAIEGQTGAAVVMKRTLELLSEMQVDPSLPERPPVIEEAVHPDPAEELAVTPSPVHDVQTDPTPVKDAAQGSKTILGALAALFGAIVQWFETASQALLDAAAQLTAWEPAKEVLAGMGGNTASIGFGITVAAVVLVVSRRLDAAAKGKVG